MIRKSNFANSWYPGNPNELKKTITGYMPHIENEVKAIGALVPHAGYVYSGRTAGELFASINIPENVIILSPNHTGLGKKASVMADGEWQTPFGNISINSKVAHSLIDKCDILEDDESAHVNEHSIELELPFIYQKRNNVKIVPITLKYLSIDECYKIGSALAKLMIDQKDEFLILASSDMSHGETLENTERKDKLAIDRILALDAKGLHDRVVQNNISMCGFIPVTIMVYASTILNATRAVLVKKTNSFEISGRKDYIVGYASMYIE